mmetsp:Transcript_56352/g.143461  ORF Transcript_56352/g.143461 Transcript_56352/m.143461 type:complete len:245 (-) Transcript_56352:450-1184(-)
MVCNVDCTSCIAATEIISAPCRTNLRNLASAPLASSCLNILISLFTKRSTNNLKMLRAGCAFDLALSTVISSLDFFCSVPQTDSIVVNLHPQLLYSFIGRQFLLFLLLLLFLCFFLSLLLLSFLLICFLLVCLNLCQTFLHLLELLELFRVPPFVRVQLKSHLFIHFVDVAICGIWRKAQKCQCRSFLEALQVGVGAFSPLLDLRDFSIEGIDAALIHIIIEILSAPRQVFPNDLRVQQAEPGP